MMRRRGELRWLAATATCLGIWLAAMAWWRSPNSAPPAESPKPPAPLSLPAPVSATADGHLDWLVVGGGATPSTNQYGIEADVAEVMKTFAGPGGAWFSGGARALAVQVRQSAPRGDPLRRRLGRFFWPRQGRDASYRRTRLRDARVGSRPAVLAALRRQLGKAANGPLLVWVAGHGEVGDTPAANGVPLWGGGRLVPADFADLLAGPDLRRTMTVVMTTCFSGGFAEMIFAGADHRQGPARVLACGLFAAPWDLESSGCDANPDRRQHEGYARHFLSALRGRDRQGRGLPAARIDFDHDGRISLLEAHTRVRMVSSSADVPTSTSERWLRKVAPRSGAGREVPLVEEHAVIQHLAARLRLPDAALRGPGPLAVREAGVEQAQQAVDLARADEDAAWHDVAAQLLGRWPVLDDPWHPDFPATLLADREAITTWLDRSPRWRGYGSAVAVTDAASRLLDEARIAAALAERLERALDNVALAARLQVAGGEDLARWQELLRCERRVPALASGDGR